MIVQLNPHAARRLLERGATEAEVVATVENGERFPAKHGRTGFRRNFPFAGLWRGRPYANSNWRPTPSKRTTVGWSSRSWCAIFKEGKPMQLTYDPRHNIAYIRLREKSDEVETLRISDELNIDLAPDGAVYGIELLNASAQLYGSEGASLVVWNEQLQLRKQISLGEA
jgi:uncharacterized protein YuzE